MGSDGWTDEICGSAMVTKDLLNLYGRSPKEDPVFEVKKVQFTIGSRELDPQFNHIEGQRN